jgi:predicted  nucleic acid-binding Zn ribbon protein
VISAITYFKICARANQSLILSFTGVEIVKATLKARHCENNQSISWQIVYCVYAIAQIGPNRAKQSVVKVNIFNENQAVSGEFSKPF